MIICEHEQYTPEWWKERLGVPTASEFKHIILPDGKPSKSAQKYLHRLAVERVTGNYAGSDYSSAAMKRGHKYEPEARSLFGYIHDVEVRQVGLCFQDEQKKWAASPDGLLEYESKETGLEIFCPESDNAVNCLFNPDKAMDIADKYQQIQGTMMIGDFDHYYYIVYYPGLPPLIIRVERDEKFIDKLRVELEKFCKELEATVERLRNL
jgi:hypothetical protein